ncbi:phage gene 29 protein family protein [Nocardia goodfellowii]
MSAKFPTYENCQPPEGEEPDPKKIYQWALSVLPFSGSTPMIVQEQARAEWSELLYDLGFVHDPDRQTKRVQLPVRGQQHYLNGAAQIVPVDAPEPDPTIIPDPLEYTPHEQAVMAERLYHAGMLGDRLPAYVENRYAEEESGPAFEPADHSPSTVNGYLMAAQPAERRRVIAAEMTGKQRDQILRKWKGV